MSEVQKLDLSIDEIRGLILEVFKGNPSSQYLSVCNDVAELVVKKGIVPNVGQGVMVHYCGRYVSLNPN